jgi:hypothetical protein
LTQALLSFGLAALPPDQMKKIVISLLPQANNARCGASIHANAIVDAVSDGVKRLDSD